MHGILHVMFNADGVSGQSGVDNSLPMAILSVLVTHRIGAVPHFPMVSQVPLRVASESRERAVPGSLALC